jgi:hypothetical protein
MCTNYTTLNYTLDEMSTIFESKIDGVIAV